MVRPGFPVPIGGRIGEIAESLLAVTQRSLGLLALGDVPEMHHGGLHTGLRKQVDDHILDPARRSVLVKQQTLSPDDGAGLLQELSQSIDRFPTIIRMDKIESAAPNELLRSISQHPLD